VRIAIFAAYYLPHIGGFEKNVHELSKRLVARGHKVTIITNTLKRNMKTEMMDGVRIIRLPSWLLFGGTYHAPKLSKKALRKLWGLKCDVVMTQTRIFAFSLLGTVMARLRGLPHVHVERGTCHPVVTSKFIDLLSKANDHVLGSLIVKSARFNVGVSEAAREFVGHMGGKNAVVIHNGIESGRARQEHQTTIITYIGRLIYAKGVQDLLDAFAETYRLHSKIKLFIVGDGDYRHELEKKAHSLRCANSIVFTGEKDNQAVMEILGITDIFINPSYSEGLPTSVMEAASIGLPIVATNVGGTREIIKNGMSGILVKPHQPFQIHNAIEYFLSNPVSAKAMGMSAKTLALRKFNWDRITDEYERLLNEAIND
jgi:glycosyltransferase involved in cell wall biosynthesis